MINIKPKFLLFDIDGTILSTKGVPRTAMKTILERRFDYFAYDDNYNYSGRTDWQIIDHLLDYGEIDYPRDYNSLKLLFDDFAVELKKEMGNGIDPHIFDGVTDLIKSLDDNEKCYLGLLTGNIAAGAKIKLEAANLYKYFPTGAFGDDAKNRNDLADIAIKRLKQYYKLPIEKQNVWIIGDSIHDIRCAKSNGLRSLAVCTGFTERSELESENPDYIVESFKDTQSIMSLFFYG